MVLLTEAEARKRIEEMREAACKLSLYAKLMQSPTYEKALALKRIGDAADGIMGDLEILERF